MKTVMTTAKPNTSADPASFSHKVQVDALARKSESKIELRPEAAALASMAAQLALLGLRKVSLLGHLSPVGDRDWHLQARIGATIVQPCVVSLVPVTTRIDEPVERIWLAKMPDLADTSGDDEMIEDTSAEQLEREIDLGRVLSEALALALPLYPRAEGATLEQENFAAPGVTPMRDEDTRPFAGLAALRADLETDPDSEA